MADVGEPRILAFRNNLGGVIGAPVVKYQQIEVPVSLAQDGLESRPEVMTPVMGHQGNGQAIGHGCSDY
jgi:hypothetical protein